MADASETAKPHPCPHPEAVGTRWGDPISEERQAELQARLDAWDAESDHGDRRGPIDDVKLTGAEVGWLADRVRDEYGRVPGLHLEGAILREAHLEGAYLGGAHLERAVLIRAQLGGAYLTLAQLQGAILRAAHLKGAILSYAHLDEANLHQAQLEEITLHAAELAGADLSSAQLQGAHLQGAKLARANLRGATLDHKSNLSGVALATPLTLRERLFGWLPFAARNTSASLGNIAWGGVGTVDLSSVKWDDVQRLGDERRADLRDGLFEHEAVVRAYRQVAAQLRAQGMADHADRFAYRAQIRQRGVLLRTFRLPQYIFSWLLALLAGYGYRPGRTIFWYLAVVAGFAFMYMQATLGWVPFGLPHPSSFAPLPWYEALILSVSSFHGRGFFQPLQSLGDPIAALAAIEAVLGLFIEISFIATFTQRFFGAR